MSFIDISRPLNYTPKNCMVTVDVPMSVDFNIVGNN